MTDEPIGILLADDTDDMRFLLEAAFGSSRFDVVDVAVDGEAALASWQANRDRIRAAALDQRMPGLEGLDVAKRILADDPSVAIVLFSAELTRELVAQAEALGIATLHKDQVLTLPEHPAFAHLG